MSRATMQCQSYFPLHNSHYDLNSDTNGGFVTSMPSYNSNGIFGGGRYNQYVSSTSVSAGSLELLRQTILEHEATFRDQVQELHRLYWRQKELMNEIRRTELYMNHLQSEGQSANSFIKYSSGGDAQNSFHSLPLFNFHCKPSAGGVYDIRSPFDSIKEQRIPATSVVSQIDNSSNNLQSLESKGRKIGRKFLDLELPAEVYIDDSEEGESLGDAKFLEPPTSLSSHKPSKAVVNVADLNEPTMASCTEKNSGVVMNEERDYDPELSNRSHEQINEGKAKSDGPSSILIFLARQVENANSEACSGSSWRKSSTGLEKNPCVVQALPCFANQLSSNKGGKMCGKLKWHINDKFDSGSRCNKSLKSSCSQSSLKDSVVSVSPLAHIDLTSDATAITDFTPSNGAAKSDEITRKGKKCRLIDINLPCDSGIEGETLTEEDTIGDDYKNASQMNLCTTNDNGSLPKSLSSSSHKLAFEMDLEAPPSPEVEECPPPRGDSEENHPETGQISTQEYGNDQFEELAKIAADTIVSLSLPMSRDLQKCKASDGEALEWFAGLIDSGILNSMDTSEVDEFEAMTLNLTEMKEEEYWLKDIPKISNVTCSIPIPYQTRKGRTRRSKRKDFQREVLPSLASLSRYEVTEDIQMIEGLMEAAGTPWHLTRTRRACRMGRKPRVRKMPTYSISDVPDMKERALIIGWGKANRRPRGRRTPASPSIILTRWLVYFA